MRDIYKQLERLVRPTNDSERLDVLHSNTFALCLQLLESNPSPRSAFPHQMDVVAAGWYESQTVRRQVLESPAENPDIAIAQWTSPPRPGFGVIERIAVMQLATKDILILERIPETGRRPFWAIWEIPAAHNPPSIVSLRAEPFPSLKNARFKDIESGFATAHEIQHYRQLLLGTLPAQRKTAPV